MRKTVGVLALFGAGCLFGGGLLAGCAGDDAAMGVTVSTTEMKFGPASIGLPAGRQTFTVVNDGKLRHTFSLNDLGQEVTVAPGQTKTLSVDLEPGTYRYVCRVLDHEGLGMRGVLKVRTKQ
ncbi:MAG: cupredoxin domain-containing protein [Acidimicrobiales bacterium]|nr:cupredoxin domain-containing protein [Acidimicrobiales bacterium]